MAHTNKADPSGDMSYFQIRDSSFIAQESDCVLMVKRDINNKKDKTEAFLNIEFHRRTGAMREMVKLKKQGNYLVELNPITEDWQAPY